MTDTREERRARKRADARGIEQTREHLGTPAPQARLPPARAGALSRPRRTEPVSEKREQRRERKRAEARGIEQFREHIGNPAPLTMTPQAVYHWNRDDQFDALIAAREGEPDTGFMMRLLALWRCAPCRARTRATAIGTSA